MMKSLLCLLLGAAMCYATVSQDHLVTVVNKDHIVTAGDQDEGGGLIPGGTIGSCGYDPLRKVFYTAAYGSFANIRVFDPCVFTDPCDYTQGMFSDETGTSWSRAYPSDMVTVSAAIDFPTASYAEQSGLFRPFSVLLNPAPMTFAGQYYDAYELAVMISTDYYHGPRESRSYGPTRRLMTYDLREIGAPTTMLPDYNTAHYDDDVFGAYGIADWNDVFNNLVTAQDLADALGISTTTDTSPNVARRPSWSTDCTKVYFTSISTNYYGGLWYVDTTQAPDTAGRVHCLLYVTEGTNKLGCESWVMPTTLRDFTNGTRTGDQVLICGTTVWGNEGGLSCVIGEDTPDPNEQVYDVLTAEKFITFIDLPDPCWADPTTFPGARSICSDAEGNIYFGMTDSYNIYMYDKYERLLCLRTRPQLYEYQKDEGKTSLSANMYQLQHRIAPDPRDPCGIATIGQLFHQNTGMNVVSGIYLFKPLDFNRDDVINVDDTEFFKAQLELTWAETVPAIADEQVYVDYLLADLNGNAQLNSSSTSTAEYLLYPAVTETDIEALYQFLLPGDANFDNKVDLADLAIFVAGYNAGGSDKTWAQGDFDFDSDVDMVDFSLMSSQWLNTLP